MRHRVAAAGFLQSILLLIDAPFGSHLSAFHIPAMRSAGGTHPFTLSIADVQMCFVRQPLGSPEELGRQLSSI
jgi:hypothetical protein